MLMGLLDFILNLVGLLLWFNWRAARFDPLTISTPATLAGTLRRAEKSKLRSWHLPFGILLLLLIRIPLYHEFGSALKWSGKVNLAVISIPFPSNTPSYLSMTLFSFYSFGVALGVFLLWVLLLSLLKSGAPESDSLRQLLRLHLGPLDSWPVYIKLLLPFFAVAILWYGASWPLTHYGILPPPHTAGQRVELASIVGVGSYLAWRNLVLAILILYFLHSYVYFGKNPFWQHLDLVAQRLLVPFRWFPSRLGRFDLSPLLAIVLVILAARIAEQGFEFPGGKNNASGQTVKPLVNLPGLVDWYRRASS